MRVRGVRQILQIMDKDAEFRSLGYPPPTFQQFIVPKINFDADHYSNLINISHDKYGHFYYTPADFYAASVRRLKIRLTVPPMLRKYSRSELIDFMRKPLVTDYLCHSQPCERGVKLTTEATSGKMRYELQLGQALMAEQCREEWPDIVRKRLFE